MENQEPSFPLYPVGIPCRSTLIYGLFYIEHMIFNTLLSFTHESLFFKSYLWHHDNTENHILENITMSVYVITQNVTVKPTYGLGLIPNTNSKPSTLLPKLSLGSWNPKIWSFPLPLCVTFQGMFILASPKATFHSINVISLPKWCMGYSKIQTYGKLSGIMIKIHKVFKWKKWCLEHINEHP